MIRIDYFGAWREDEFSCPACSWKGSGSELASEMFDELFTLDCPKCDYSIAGAPYPMFDEVKEAADSGHPEAIDMLRRQAEWREKHGGNSES